MKYFCWLILSNSSPPSINSMTTNRRALATEHRLKTYHDNQQTCTSLATKGVTLHSNVKRIAMTTSGHVVHSTFRNNNGESNPIVMVPAAMIFLLWELFPRELNFVGIDIIYVDDMRVFAALEVKGDFPTRP